MDRAALFVDETEDYRIPEEPDENSYVTLRFRTGKGDVDQVSYLVESSNTEIKMHKVSSDEMFDYYEHQIRVYSEPVKYYFQIVKGDEVCYYNRLGATSDIQSCFCFCITPGFHTPDWIRGAAMYQIFVDRFCNADPSNDVVDNEYIYIGQNVKCVKDWYAHPEEMDVGCFYGGDLKGVWTKLDYIQSLGVKVIYLNPIFVSPSNHKYDCQDYDYIDPHYTVIPDDGGSPLGAKALDNNTKASKYLKRTTEKKNLEASNEFFAEFVKAVHERGMKIIIDGVFNHCGSFNKWLDKERIYEKAGNYEPGAYVSEDSPYRSFFKFFREDAWPYNGSYDGWWGHDTLPKLNYEESPKLYDYIMKIAAKWVSPPYNVDGWRLDVAADLGKSSEFNHKFWRDFRKTVKEANPEAVILAEHYGDPSSWLAGDQWDTVMNYDAFMEPVSWFLTGMEKHSDEYNQNLYGDGETFFRSMNYHMSRMQWQSLSIAMNELSNHDHSRFLTRTNHTVGRTGSLGPEAASEGINKAVLREAVLIQMTWPGAPTVYYGDEAGLCGFTDPDNRRTYPWGKEDLELIEYHRYIIGIHNRLDSLKRGSLKQLIADRQLIAYGRMHKRQKCVVIINNGSGGRKVEVPVWQLGIRDRDILTRVMLTDSKCYSVGMVDYKVEDGILDIEMPETGGALFVTGIKR